MNSFWLKCTAFRKNIFKLLYCTHTHLWPLLSGCARAYEGSLTAQHLFSCHGSFFLQKYPPIWTGYLELKHLECKVQMQFVDGHQQLFKLCFSEQQSGGPLQRIRINQRLSLSEQKSLQSLSNIIQVSFDWQPAITVILFNFASNLFL